MSITEQLTLDFGFEAEYNENLGEYTTISGNPQKNMTNAAGYNINFFSVGDYITGYPEVIIFDNDEKDENGEYKRKSQSARLRIIEDEDSYVDLYANIPRRDEKGFIKGLNKYFNFFRTGFDLVFSFMRFIDETNVIDSNGEEINNIKIANIEHICKAIDSMENIKVKVVESGDENYPSFIIVDMNDN